MFDRILIPLDGSETAEAILHQLRRLILIEKTEIVLLRSVSILASGMGAYPMSGIDGTFLLRDLEAEAARYLAGVAERLTAEGATVRWVVKVGNAADTILDVVRTEGATIIAMSTHGRSGVTRWLLGSVTEKVLRASPVPLLLARSFRPDEQGEMSLAGPGELPVTKILVPTDLSGTSLRLAPQVAELARLYQARVEVVHVLDFPEDWQPPGEEVETILAQAVEAFDEQRIDVVPLLRWGDAATAILRVGEERSIDLIAMTTHGRTGFRRWWLGSVAEKVLRAASVPMLIVRDSESAAEEESSAPSTIDAGR